MSLLLAAGPSPALLLLLLLLLLRLLLPRPAALLAVARLLGLRGHVALVPMLLLHGLLVFVLLLAPLSLLLLSHFPSPC